MERSKNFLPTIFLPKFEENPLYCSWNAWLKLLPTHSEIKIFSLKKIKNLRYSEKNRAFPYLNENIR